MKPETQKPHRVQLSRKKGWRMPPNTVVVARPSKYGNPHRVGFCPVCGVEHTQAEAVAKFEADCIALPRLYLADLKGKNLACWCKIINSCGFLEQCHADILLELANGMTKEAVRNENLKSYRLLSECHRDHEKRKRET